MAADQGLRARLARTLGFFRKELFSVFRQPRLILTLILGPFLILLIFGLGYRDSHPPFRTVLVLGNENAEIAADREDLSEAFGTAIDLQDISTDLQAARVRLTRGEVDLLIVAPEEPLRSLDAGEKARFRVIHGLVDPVVRSRIRLLAQLSVDEINRRVMADMIQVAQEETVELEGPVAALQESFERSVGDRDAEITRIWDLEPDLLVSPFGVEVTQLNDVTDEPGAVYSPGTLVVLVQHLAVTFAALSLVRERQLGLTGVFRASPLASGEALAGKYLGFGVIAAGVAAALSGAILLFGVRILGSVIEYASVLALLILAALGLGFVLSGLSRTDTQAVQYSMLILLVSIFFTGFVLPLEQLAGPVQVVSYLIPATYGIGAAHDVIFRGRSVDPVIFGGLLIYALLLGVAAWLVIRRDVKLVRN